MSIFEHVRQMEADEAMRANAHAGEREHNDPKEKETTLKEVLADQSELFGMYLEREGQQELGKRVLESALKESDIEELNKHREAFLRIQERRQKMESAFDVKNVEAMVAMSPKLKEVAQLVGADGISEAFLNRLPEMAITDPARFKKIERVLVSLEVRQDMKKEEDERVAVLCKKYGMDPREYAKAIYTEDPRKLEKLIAKGMGFIERNRKKHLSHEFDAEVAAADRRGQIDRLRKQYDVDLEEVAKALSATLVENPAMRKSLSQVMKGENLDRGEDVASFAELQGFRSWADHPDEKELDAAWEEFKTSNAGGDNEKMKDNFSEMFFKKKGLKGKGGFWGKLGQMIFGPKLRERLK